MTGISMFDLEAKSLSVCETRSVMLARNLANANTPHYKATDLNFQEALLKANQSTALNATHSAHLQSNQSPDGQRIYYRIPTETNLDGNTVDDDIERKNFVENALRYQASLEFAQNKASSLLKAIKGN